MTDYTIISLSEFALLISFGQEINLSLHDKVMQAKQLIESSSLEGLIETVPAYNSLAVYYNPLLIETKTATIASTVENHIIQALTHQSIQQTSNQSNNQIPISIPVCYDQILGIDLDELSNTLNLGVEEIIQLHSSRTYKVFMTGFTPGFAYMGSVDEKLITQRKAQPRLKVEPGSVAIAGNQTGIYPLATPGGWNIIGKTPLTIFDKEKSNPFLLKAGDLVKFVPITKDEFERFPKKDKFNHIKLPAKSVLIKKQIIHIEQCGFLTTIQDEGRNRTLQYGVSKGGAIDLYSLKLANILIGNADDAPVLEITQAPHRFHFLKDVLVAFAGGGLQPIINETLVPLYQPVFIKEGSIIELKKQLPGFRLYMAVAGGFTADQFLHSHSTDLLVNAGGYKGRILKKEDILESEYNPTTFQKNLLTILKNGAELKLNLEKVSFEHSIIRVIKGAEWNFLTDLSKQIIIASVLNITPQSNRMGYRLKGEKLTTEQSYDIISSPVTQGTVQLTASGELIVLMADAQTVGGYPRVLQVIAADVFLLAQKKPGEMIQFEIVSFQQAEECYFSQTNVLKKTKLLLHSSG